jgi:hypothetical protein
MAAPYRSRFGGADCDQDPRHVATCPRGHVDEDLLRDARKKAYVLLLATDGLLSAGTYMHEEPERGKFDAEALQWLAYEVSHDLAELGKQAARSSSAGTREVV